MAKFPTKFHENRSTGPKLKSDRDTQRDTLTQRHTVILEYYFFIFKKGKKARTQSLYSDYITFSVYRPAVVLM
jgi:hypothetical protein